MDSSKLGRNPFDKAKLQAVPTIKDIVREEAEEHAEKMRAMNDPDYTGDEEKISASAFKAQSPEYLLATIAAGAAVVAIRALISIRVYFSRK
jgi:hypothetical protein